MTTTAYDIADNAAELLALAWRYEQASVEAQAAWKAYCTYFDAALADAPHDATLADLYARHIAADDAAGTRYTTLLAGLAKYTDKDRVSLAGTVNGQAVVIDWSRTLGLAAVNVTRAAVES